jgi:hypothetical protein
MISESTRLRRKPSARLALLLCWNPATKCSFLKRDPHGHVLSIFQKAKMIPKSKFSFDIWWLRVFNPER